MSFSDLKNLVLPVWQLLLFLIKSPKLKLENTVIRNVISSLAMSGPITLEFHSRYSNLSPKGLSGFSHASTTRRQKTSHWIREYNHSPLRLGQLMIEGFIS